MMSRTWYIIKGMKGEPVLCVATEIKSNTEVLHQFKAKGFLEAHRYVSRYRREGEYLGKYK